MPRPLALLTAAAVALALTAPATARGADDALAAALQEQAPRVIAHAKKKGFTNLGVLKFLVRRGDGPPGDVGDLTLSLANKTEVALILANTDERFGIIDKASAFVEREKMTTANHLTAAGRRAFFTRKYDLAWSRDKVTPDGFVTGVVTLAPDLESLSVQLQLFDKTGAIEDLPGAITAKTDPETLGQAGYSYAIAPLRQKVLVAGGPPPAADVRRAEVVESARKAAEADAASAPLADSPVRLTVLYNGKPVPVTGGSVPEPKAGDRVEFVLDNPGPGTYAVALLVNGENTLYQERAAPLECRKWVLAPGTGVTVSGFQTDAETTAPFRVVPPEDLGPDVVRYGLHAGTYRMVVYHGTMSADPPKDDRLVDTNMIEAAVLAIARTRGETRPAGVKPQSLRALQATLRGRAQSAEGARGYVVKGGAKERFETEAVHFTPSSDTPVADINLRYCTLRK